MFKFIYLKNISKISLVLIVLGIGVGLLITSQWRTKPLRVSNPVVPYAALRDTREDLSDEQKQLKTQLALLQENIDQEQKELKKRFLTKNKAEELAVYKERLGLAEIKSQGVVITMDDAKSGPSSIDAITHAADLRDLVNFLWRSNATAISINEERIVFLTSIDCIVNTILINNTKTTNPFVIKAIGNQKILYEQLNNPLNLKDIHKRVKEEGLILEIKKENEVNIPSYKGVFTAVEAKVAETR